MGIARFDSYKNMYKYEDGSTKTKLSLRFKIRNSFIEDALLCVDNQKIKNMERMETIFRNRNKALATGLKKTASNIKDEMSNIAENFFSTKDEISTIQEKVISTEDKISTIENKIIENHSQIMKENEELKKMIENTAEIVKQQGEIINKLSETIKENQQGKSYRSTS